MGTTNGNADKQQSEQRKEFRKYFLGFIKSEDELTRIEESLMTSDEYFQDFLIEEEDLIQNYVDGYLAKNEAEAFENFYLNSEDKRKKVKFAQSLREFVNIQTKPKSFQQWKIREEITRTKKSFWDLWKKVWNKIWNTFVRWG